MSNYLFMITIPAVGKIISSSRKTEDIWAGSMLFAYLLREILKKIKLSKYGDKIEMVFPSSQAFHENYANFANISNKILLILSEVGEEDVKDLAIEVKRHLRDLLHKILDFALSKCDITDASYRDLACYQAESTIELFWAGLEIRDDYKMTRQELENYIGYLKDAKIRMNDKFQGHALIEPLNISDHSYEDFQKTENYLKYCHGAYTCSICGENSILGATISDFKGTDFWKKLWDKEKSKFKKGERLCGFCLAKRYLREFLGVEAFQSTSEIASISFKRKLIVNSHLLKDLHKIFQKVFNELPRTNPVKKLKDDIKKLSTSDEYEVLFLDGEWFMVDTWKNPNSYEPLNINAKDASLIANDLENFNKKFSHPSEMYAILKLDGDNMGAKISALDKDGQKKLSDLQNDFSKEVSNIIYEHYGASVYIGGDDVLAFLPVNTAIECAQNIRNAYSKKMEPMTSLLPKGDKYKFTLTGAIIVAHHLLPLRYVLDELYRLEKDAKSQEEKDSLGIKLIKHSLTSETVILGWQKLMELVNLPSIPKTFVYQLANETHILKGLNFEMRKSAIKSLLKRKVNKEEIENIIDILLRIDADINPENLASFLKLAMELKGG